MQGKLWMYIWGMLLPCNLRVFAELLCRLQPVLFPGDALLQLHAGWKSSQDPQFGPSSWRTPSLQVCVYEHTPWPLKSIMTWTTYAVQFTCCVFLAKRIYFVVDLFCVSLYMYNPAIFLSKFHSFSSSEKRQLWLSESKKFCILKKVLKKKPEKKSKSYSKQEGV